LLLTRNGKGSIRFRQPGTNFGVLFSGTGTDGGGDPDGGADLLAQHICPVDNVIYTGPDKRCRFHEGLIHAQLFDDADFVLD